MKKKIVSLLTLSLLVSASILTSANQNSNANVIENDNLVSTDIESNYINEDISPLITESVAHTFLSNRLGSESVPFNLTSAMPHYKVWVHNTSKVNYQVTITSKTSAGTLQDHYTVKPGESPTKFYSANLGLLSSKARYVNVTSSDGSPLTGVVSVRIGSTLAELK